MKSLNERLQIVEEHVKIGIKSLSTLINRGSTVKHLRFDW